MRINRGELWARVQRLYGAVTMLYPELAYPHHFKLELESQRAVESNGASRYRVCTDQGRNWTDWCSARELWSALSGMIYMLETLHTHKQVEVWRAKEEAKRANQNNSNEAVQG